MTSLKLVDLLHQEIDKVQKWEKTLRGELPAYQGKTQKWRFTVLELPAGGVGEYPFADGAAVMGTFSMRLTPELATKAYLAATGKKDG